MKAIINIAQFSERMVHNRNFHFVIEFLIFSWESIQQFVGVMVRRVTEARHRCPSQWYSTHFKRNCGDAFSKRILEGKIAW